MPILDLVNHNPFLGTFQTVFYILAVCDLILGVDLIVVSLWSLMRKLPYYILLEVRVDILYFTIPVAVLCLPIFLILLSARRSEVRLHLIVTLIALQLLSISTLIAAPHFGFMYTYKEDDTAARFTSSLDIKDLNSSLQHSFSKYDSANAVQFAWKRMQHQLCCCGITNSDDWAVSGKVMPGSCCQNGNCLKNKIFTQGCLASLCRDLAWQRNVLSSHCHAGVIVHATEAIIAGVTYLSANQFKK